MKENRLHLRITHRAELKITFSSGENVLGHTRDMSDGGLFIILCPEHPPVKTGDILIIIVLVVQDAVAREVEVIRTDSKGGIAVKFTGF
jgi:hypothetical protein